MMRSSAHTLLHDTLTTRHAIRCMGGLIHPGRMPCGHPHVTRPFRQLAALARLHLRTRAHVHIATFARVITQRVVRTPIKPHAASPDHPVSSCITHLLIITLIPFSCTHVHALAHAPRSRLHGTTHACVHEGTP